MKQTVIIFFLLISAAYGSETVLSAESNIQLFSRFATETGKNINGALSEYNIDTLYLEILDSSENNSINLLIEIALLEANPGLTLIQSKENKLPILTLQITDCSVSYTALNADEVLRNANLTMAAVFKAKSGVLQNITIPPLSGKDTLDWDLAATLNNNSPLFARGNLPERPRTFYKKIIEPILIVATAVMTVALFFSIRSK